ncbi:MAG TPA: YCF48-related protein [Acidimicrobiia bacterium]
MSFHKALAGPVAAVVLLVPTACRRHSAGTAREVTAPAPSGSTVTASTTATTASPKVSSGRLRPAPVLFGAAVLLPDEAGQFVDVTPPHGSEEYIHDAFFVDRNHGWVGFTDSSAASGRLVRTDDGGRTWETVAPATHRHQSGGSRVWLFFLDRRVGWTVSYAASAPAGGIYRTLNGGGTWSDYTALPEPGPVRFTTRDHGWLAGYSVFGNTGGLYETFNGGLTWTRRSVPPPAGTAPGDLAYRLPTFDGAEGILPVSAGDDRVAFYRSSDGGRTWRPAAIRAVPGGPKVAVAVASRSVWWAVAAEGGPVSVTTDAGRTWTTRPRVGLPETIIDFEATDDRTAWASAAGNGELRLYATSDGGATWHPVS